MSARCPCGRAGLPDGADECGLCELDQVNGVPRGVTGLLTRAQLLALPKAELVEKIVGLRQDIADDASDRATAPTARPPASERCACGRLDVPGVAACRGCLDPVEQAFSAWLAAEAADEGLTPEQRVQLRRRRTAHVNARTTARLAAGPP